MTSGVALPTFSGYSRRWAIWDAYRKQLAIWFTTSTTLAIAWHNPSTGALIRFVEAPVHINTLLGSLWSNLYNHVAIHPDTGDVWCATLQNSSNFTRILSGETLAILATSANHGYYPSPNLGWTKDRAGNTVMFAFSQLGGSSYTYTGGLVRSASGSGAGNFTTLPWCARAMSPDPDTGHARICTFGRPGTGAMDVTARVLTCPAAGQPFSTQKVLFDDSSRRLDTTYGITLGDPIADQVQQIPNMEALVFFSTSPEAYALPLDGDTPLWQSPAPGGVAGISSHLGRTNERLAYGKVAHLVSTPTSLLSLNLHTGEKTYSPITGNDNGWTSIGLPNGAILSSVTSPDGGDTLIFPSVGQDPTPITLSPQELEGFRSVRLARNNTTGVINSMVEELQESLTLYADEQTSNLVDMNSRRISNLPEGVLFTSPIRLSQAQSLANV